QHHVDVGNNVDLTHSPTGASHVRGARLSMPLEVLLLHWRLGRMSDVVSPPRLSCCATEHLFAWHTIA
ncbi:MAG: hypothetical protein ACKO1K_11705, partial [Burkholderiales bacterium]